MNKLTYAVILVAALVTKQAALAQAGLYKLTISIPNIEQRTGTLRLGLVSKAANFMATSEIDTAVAVPAQGPLIVTFPNLKAGRYAVQVYQDINDNKTMDRAGGRPTEPFGFSNIALLMGLPTFEEAAVEVKQDTDIRIRLMSM